MIFRVIRPPPPFRSTSETSRGKEPVYAPSAISREISPGACPELAEGAFEEPLSFPPFFGGQTV